MSTSRPRHLADPPRRRALLRGGIAALALTATLGAVTDPAALARGGGGGTGGGSTPPPPTVPTSTGPVVWPADVPFPAGTVTAHFATTTDWTASLTVHVAQPKEQAALDTLYTRAGFTIVSRGIPEVLTKGRYTLRVQCRTRDHVAEDSLVTLQLHRA